MRTNKIHLYEALHLGRLSEPVPKIHYPHGTASEFCKNVFIAAKNKVVNFIIGCYNHWESIIILVLASWGLTSIMGEIPFWFTVPAWIESPLLLPVLSVIGIYLLISNGERRTNNRLALAMA